MWLQCGAVQGKPRRHQAGVAAVEFAFLLTLMLLIFGGITAYWHILQVQQSVSRATGDGARMLQQLSMDGEEGFDPRSGAGRAALEQKIAKTVKQSLKGAGLPFFNEVEIAVKWESGKASLQVAYPYELFGDAFAWVVKPQQLHATAVVQLSVSL